MKIKKYIVFFYIFFLSLYGNHSISAFAVSEGTSQVDIQSNIGGDEGNASEKNIGNANDSNNVITIKDIINKANNDEELQNLTNNINNQEKELEKNNIEYESIKGLINSLNEEMSKLQGKIDLVEENNVELIKNIGNESVIQQNKTKIDDLNNEIQSLKSDIIYYQEKQKELTKDKFEKNEILNKYLELKNKVETERKNNQNEKLNNILLGYILFLALWIIIYLFINLKYKHNNKDHLKFNLIQVNILFIFLFFISIVFNFFYINPSKLVYLIFISSALLLIFKEIIISFFSSLFIVSKYKVGEIIEVKGKNIRGKISNIGLTNLEILSVDEKNNYTNEKIKIPNFTIITSNVSIQPNENIVNDSFSFYVNNLENYKNFSGRIEPTLNKKIVYSLKNLGNKDNEKFKKIIKIKQGKVLITYNWNDTIQNNLIIKEIIIEFLINNNLLNCSKDIEKGIKVEEEDDENQLLNNN